MKVLLDTNAYSALVRGHREVVAHVRFAREALMSVIVVGELLQGFRQGDRFEQNTHRLERFLNTRFATLLPVTYATADRFSQIAASLRKRGKPIPSNDMWIAAHALENGAQLLSSDSHFGLIDGLSWLRFSPDREDSLRERIHPYYATPQADPA